MLPSRIPISSLLARTALPPEAMSASWPLHRRVEANSLSRIQPILPTQLGFQSDTASALPRVAVEG